MNQSSNAEPEHLLLVEDDKDLRESLRDALRLEGYEVVCVENGEVALRYLGGGARPCLILLDLMMPVMDGWTFRQELLKNPALAAIPVVLMTAASPGQAKAIAADAILYKPLQMDSVVEVVQEHCPDGGR
jgi:CheY-like chemotaxis protein